MKISARELANLLKGSIEGDPDVMVHAPSKIEEGKKGTITFLGNMKYESYAYSTNASIILVPSDFEPTTTITATLIKVPNVYQAMSILMDTFGEVKERRKGVSEYSIISSSQISSNISIGHFTVIQKNVSIGDNTSIGDQVFIGEGCKIGIDCIIYPGVKLYPNTVVGDRCIIHAGSVIGCDGFGYSKGDDNRYKKIQHVGVVIIEDDVEIGANTVIDRATMGETRIKRGVKLDNLIQVAHNVEIGEDTVMAAQSGVAGSSKIGNRVVIGGQAGIVGHRKIADEVQIQAQSGVISNVKEVGKRLYGYPAIEYQSYLRAFALMKNLPELKDRIISLEKEIELLKNQTKQND